MPKYAHCKRLKSDVKSGNLLKKYSLLCFTKKEVGFFPKWMKTNMKWATKL